MTVFETYLRLGLNHILDLNGLDHIVFILLMVAPFEAKHWKPIFIMVTAFTLGHSVTLALAALNVFNFDSRIIELGIAFSILLAALLNVVKQKHDQGSLKIKYTITTLFGLIHGLGFSNFLKALLGKETDIIQPLFAFNIGLELGQLLVVASLFLLFFILSKLAKIKQRDLNLFISGGGFLVSLMMLIERW